MLYIIIVGWILATVDAMGIFLKDANGTTCLIDCDLEPDAIVSFAPNCAKYVMCNSAGFTILDCDGGKKFDDDLKTCVLPKEGDSPICNPCKGYQPYIETRPQSDCPVVCGLNEVKNVSHSFDCITYVECRNETYLTIRDCPDGHKFSDGVKACVPTAEGSEATCHPCTMAALENSGIQERIVSKNSGIHEKVDLKTHIILIFIAMIIAS